MTKHIFHNLDPQSVAACYHDWTLIAASFPAPLAGIAPFMPHEALRPVETAPGETNLTLMGMAYRRVDRLAPYNEFGILVPVSPLETRQPPEIPVYFVLQLPVTTQEARDGGILIYGYPKFVAQIDFERRGVQIDCHVGVDGNAIISLSVPAHPGELPTVDLYTYSVRGEEILKTRIEINGLSGSLPGPGASYSLGDHPLSDDLKKLEMAAIPSSSQYAPQLESILHFPERIQI